MAFLLKAERTSAARVHHAVFAHAVFAHAVFAHAVVAHAVFTHTSPDPLTGSWAASAFRLGLATRPENEL